MIERVRKSQWLFVIALFFLCALAYYDVLFHGFMIDDVQFLAPEQFLPSSSLAYYLLHTPSMHFSPGYYIVNLAAFDLFNHNSLALHAINIVLHGINAVLFYYFLYLITSRIGFSAFAAAIFLLHPVNSFTIAYIPANTIFLSSIWSLLSLIFFWRHARGGPKIWLVGSYAGFALGLMHFEGALLVPLYILGILWLIERKNLKTIFVNLLPYVLLSIGYLTIWFMTAASNAPIIGKLAANKIGWLEYLTAYGRLLAWYTGKLFYPEGVVYIYNLPKDTPGHATLLLLAGTLAAFIGCFWLCLKKRHAVSFALLWFMAGFLLVFPAIATHYNAMGFVIEPHWLYFNSMGFCLMFAIIFFAGQKFFERRSMALIGACLLIYLFMMTKYVNALSQNEERYYEYWLRASPGNTIARENLASLYIWDETLSVEADLIHEMHVQVEKYHASGNTESASSLLQRIN